jgi:hypothetical protein
MPRSLIMAMVVIMIGLAAAGVAQARGANLRDIRPWTRQQKHSLTYSGHVRELSTWDIPRLGIVRLSLRD